MKIYGSTTSPFVRRLRLLLAKHEYEFVPFNIFGKEREKLKETNPTLKIPMFEDTDKPANPVIFDSGVAFRYLSEKFGFDALTLHEQNILSVIDACSDSLVNTMLLKRSGVDVGEDKMYFNIQNERQLASFEYLENQVANGQLEKWHYPSICLLVLVEWASFRNLFDFTAYPKLLGFVEKHQEQPAVVATKPSE